MLICKTASCDTLYNWAKQQGLWHPWTETPRPGDVVIFDFGGNHSRNAHTGVVKSYSGTTAVTIEGNTSITSQDNGGAVMIRGRDRSVIKGYIRPRYTGKQTAARLLAIAQAQVGIKENPSGSNKVKYNTWYWGREVSGDAWPWCAAFVSWLFAALTGEVTDSTIPAEDTEAPVTNTTTKGGDTVTLTVNVLQKGSTGANVKPLQRLLYSMGYKGADGKRVSVDGDFGANTEYAVKAYQKKQGLVEDGIVGAATWGSLIG